MLYEEVPTDAVKLDSYLGYQYFIDKNHPLCDKGGKVYYHRHVASLHILNRWVLPDEVVHHIDGNRSNNISSNLEVLSNQEHSKLHARTNTVTLTCPVCSKEFEVQKSHEMRRSTCSVKCATVRQTKWAVSKDVLEQLIWNMPFTKLAEICPLSDVGLKKKAKSLGCRMPPAYFFNKSEDYRKKIRQENNIPDLSPQQSSKLLA